MVLRVLSESLSHISVLAEWIPKSNGPVLELGIGIGSSPILHELCRKRQLVSYENNAGYMHYFRRLKSDWHTIDYVEKWEDAPIDRCWGLAFIDVDPRGDRRKLMMRLKPWADYIIVHDTELKVDKYYHVRKLFDRWRYHKTYDEIVPSTTVLSDKREI